MLKSFENKCDEKEYETTRKARSQENQISHMSFKSCDFSHNVIKKGLGLSILFVYSNTRLCQVFLNLLRLGF